MAGSSISNAHLPSTNQAHAPRCIAALQASTTSGTSSSICQPMWHQVSSRPCLHVAELPAQPMPELLTAHWLHITCCLWHLFAAAACRLLHPMLNAGRAMLTYEGARLHC